MKAEHRKELKTNALAETLGQAMQGLKEGPSRNTLFVLFVAVVIGALIAAWFYWSSSSQAANSAQWLKWDSLAGPRQLEHYADESDLQGSMQARIARFQIARLNLVDGLQKLGSNRAEAYKNLHKAADLYEKLATESSDTPVLQQEALMSAAKAYESLGELVKAKSYYQNLAQTFPSSVQGQSAQKQLERLTNDAANLQELGVQLNPPGAP
jgi:hypothetical protein